MQKAIDADDFDLFYERNLLFHDVFIGLCGNSNLKRIVDNLKKRLYDFPQKRQWIKEWEESSIREHQEIVDFLAAGDPQSAALFLRDVHWSYDVQEKFIRKYYGANKCIGRRILRPGARKNC